MCLIVKNQKGFRSGQLKNKLYSYDKTDPKNLKLPSFINEIEDELLFDIIPQLTDKYRLNEYRSKSREELEEEKDWNDLEILYLVKFYKNQWSFIIPNEDKFFPSFIFTYNIAPLKIEIDKIIGHLYDKLNSKATSKQLENMFTYSSLEVTYLLHYFAMMHPDYKEE